MDGTAKAAPSEENEPVSMNTPNSYLTETALRNGRPAPGMIRCVGCMTEIGASLHRILTGIVHRQGFVP